MRGFTSTSLLSLVVAAIGKADPSLVVDRTRPDPMQAGTVPDGEKRALLDRFAAKHGHAAILGIGQQVELAEETPSLAVLTRSSDPAILAEKWMRLERYHHSSHRTLIETSPGVGWRCLRRSEAAPASPVENLLIAGVLLGLLALIGVRDTRLIIGDSPVDAGNAGALISGPCERFSISWSGDRAEIHERPPETGSIDVRLVGLLAGDIGRGWRLGDAARLLACSERSLQRHLARDGRRFSSILRRARMREATILLTETDTSLAEIGYCCGYADQAHFQRDFRRVTNMTPGTFRSLSREPGAAGG